jgi:acyl-CoA thioester hydrolase
MGVVYHSNYLIWMEVGRVELCRSLGIRYRDMEKEDGVLLAVAEATCRYVTPARYDDEVEILTWIESAHPRMVVFGYEMRHAETGAVLAKGQTKHIFCGRDLKPARLPAKYWPNFSIQRGSGE